MWPHSVVSRLMGGVCDRFLQDWVFHGVCRDAYGEFMIQVNDDFLVRRGKQTLLFSLSM